MKKQIGLIGLGKMGANVARRLTTMGWEVIAFNRTAEVTQTLAKEGIIGAYSLEELTQKLEMPRPIITLLPTGNPTDEMLEKLLPLLSPNDIIIEMANSFYKDTQKRAKSVESHKIKFIDVGISGGPGGALTGACLMVGGNTELFTYLKPLFTDMARFDSSGQAIAHFPGVGAGHFVKMVHNGIEYGIMQSIAEGFAIMKNSEFNLNLQQVTQIYNNGSVVESRLIGWLQESFEKYGQDLETLSGAVGFNGEGEWTAKVGTEMNIPTPVITDSVKFRKESQENPSYTGKVLTAMRNAFGGHSIEKGKMT